MNIIYDFNYTLAFTDNQDIDTHTWTRNHTEGETSQKRRSESTVRAHPVSLSLTHTHSLSLSLCRSVTSLSLSLSRSVTDDVLLAHLRAEVSHERSATKRERERERDFGNLPERVAFSEEVMRRPRPARRLFPGILSAGMATRW